MEFNRYPHCYGESFGWLLACTGNGVESDPCRHGWHCELETFGEGCVGIEEEADATEEPVLNGVAIVVEEDPNRMSCFGYVICPHQGEECRYDEVICKAHEDAHQEGGLDGAVVVVKEADELPDWTRPWTMRRPPEG